MSSDFERFLECVEAWKADIANAEALYAYTDEDGEQRVLITARPVHKGVALSEDSISVFDEVEYGPRETDIEVTNIRSFALDEDGLQKAWDEFMTRVDAAGSYIMNWFVL